MSCKNNITAECEQLRRAVMSEWHSIGGCPEVLSSKFMYYLLEEQVKANNDDELFYQYRDRIYRSRDVKFPAWLPDSLHKYWDWKAILSDVQWVYRRQAPLEHHMLERIYYHISGRWDGDQYRDAISSSRVVELFEPLTVRDDNGEDPYFIAAQFLCEMYDCTGGLPGAIRYSVVWVLAAYLASRNLPPFILWCDKIEEFERVARDTEGDRSAHLHYEKMEKFLLEQVRDSMCIYKSIIA